MARERKRKREENVGIHPKRETSQRYSVFKGMIFETNRQRHTPFRTKRRFRASRERKLVSSSFQILGIESNRGNEIRLQRVEKGERYIFAAVISRDKTAK